MRRIGSRGLRCLVYWMTFFMTGDADAAAQAGPCAREAQMQLRAATPSEGHSSAIRQLRAVIANAYRDHSCKLTLLSMTLGPTVWIQYLRCHGKLSCSVLSESQWIRRSERASYSHMPTTRDPADLCFTRVAARSDADPGGRHGPGMEGG